MAETGLTLMLLVEVATAVGAVSGLLLLLTTMWMTFRGGAAEELSLLGQVFSGFRVTYKGAFVGLLYGFFWGFMSHRDHSFIAM